MFGIGDPVTGKLNNVIYETHEQADIAAIEASIDDHIWGVWDMEGEEWVSLVFQERVFD
jgi:hypothetical protein